MPSRDRHMEITRCFVYTQAGTETGPLLGHSCSARRLQWFP